MDYRIGLLALLASASAAVASELDASATLEKTISDMPYATIFMSLTFDGTNYWSITGGYNTSTIAKYNANGTKTGQWSIGLDGRTIAYNPGDGKIYVKDYVTNSLYTLNCQAGGQFTYTEVPGFANKFQDTQSKIAFSPDGAYLYDHYNGVIRKYELATGNTLGSVALDPGFMMDFPEHYQIGTDGERFFLLDDGTIKAYAMNGTFIKDITGMPTGFYATWSFSSTENRIWAYNDNTAQWEGYDIYTIPPGTGSGAQVQLCTSQTQNAPMFPAAAMPIGIMGAALLGAYRITRKN